MSPESMNKLPTPENELGGIEELRKQLFTQVPNFYLMCRDEEEGNSSRIAPRTRVSDYSDEDTFDTVLLESPGVEDSATLEAIRRYQAFLEPLSPAASPNSMTLCVPLAILKESDETIATMMQQFEKAATNVRGGVNVMLWANAKYTDESHCDTVTRQANSKYDQLKEVLAGFESGALRITTALETLPADKLSMSVLRSHYMDALAGKVIDGTISVEHPVMWVDADTTYLSSDALEVTRCELANNPLSFCHPDIDYDLDWTKGVSARDMDTASKVLLVDEMARRASKRAAIADHKPVAERAYVEESGMGFTMLSYMLAGGVDTSDPINETARLIRRRRDFFFASYGAPRSVISKKICTVYGVTLPSMLAAPSSLRSERPYGVVWLNDTKLRLSARRLYEGMKTHGIGSLARRTGSIGGSGAYELFTDLELGDSAELPIDPAEIREVLMRPREAVGNELAKSVVDRMLANKNMNL